MILVDKRLAVIEQNLMICLSAAPVPATRPPRVREAGGTLAATHGGHHVGVGPVLEEGQGQGVDKVEILGGAGVLDHVHQGEEDVMRPLGEPDIRIKSVL